MAIPPINKKKARSVWGLPALDRPVAIRYIEANDPAVNMQLSINEINYLNRIYNFFFGNLLCLAYIVVPLINASNTIT